MSSLSRWVGTDMRPDPSLCPPAYSVTGQVEEVYLSFLSHGWAGLLGLLGDKPLPAALAQASGAPVTPDSIRVILSHPAYELGPRAACWYPCVSAV